MGPENKSGNIGGIHAFASNMSIILRRPQALEKLISIYQDTEIQSPGSYHNLYAWVHSRSVDAHDI